MREPKIVVHEPRKLSGLWRPKTALTRRLMPLYIAALLQALGFWVATEKLFMTSIGFDAATIGLMAAIYAVFVPMVEIPSGIWADRWSRRGLLVIASIALALSSLIGGLSFNVPVYIFSALVLGVFFALISGTMEAVVYDTVLEETDGSKEFEKRIGRVRLFTSVGGLAAALTGASIAALTAPRVTYFVTVVPAVLSVFVLLKFKEPRLHKMEVAVSLKKHIATTYKAILQKGKLLPIVALLVLTAMLVQVLLEFGQLWLVELEAPTLFYGVAFAALLSSLGIGGLLAGRIAFHKPLPLSGVVIAMAASALALVFVRNVVIVTAAQVLLAILIVVTSILFTRLLHDNIASSVRSGVASGVSAFSWMVFFVFSLTFGWVSNEYTVFMGGWLIFALTALSCAILLKIALDKDFKTARIAELVKKKP